MGQGQLPKFPTFVVSDCFNRINVEPVSQLVAMGCRQFNHIFCCFYFRKFKLFTTEKENCFPQTRDLSQHCPSSTQLSFVTHLLKKKALCCFLGVLLSTSSLTGKVADSVDLGQLALHGLHYVNVVRDVNIPDVPGGDKQVL